MGGRAVRRASLATVLAAVLAGTATGAPPAGEDEYVFRLAGCAACHTREGGEFLAGGPELATPFGTFYAPNITSHPERGVGRWSEADLARALHDGIAPDGTHYYPVFPYPSYTRMSPDDVGAIHRYLMAVPPSAAASRPHDIPWYLGFRILNWFWKLLFFERGPLVARADQSPSWNRGAYVAQALAHCEECHSPRNLFGVVDRARHLAGNSSGPGGAAVPNITPHRQDGIGLWSPAEIVYYLTSGEMPDGDYAGGVMAEVIDAGLQYLTPDDARALAEYLRGIPAIASPPR